LEAVRAEHQSLWQLAVGTIDEDFTGAHLDLQALSDAELGARVADGLA